MKVWSGIANLIGLVFLSLMLFNFYNMSNLMDKQFEELRLRYAVDYATESAFLSTLEVFDIGLDYDNLEDVNINPSYCLDTFKAVMCINYDMALSEANFAELETYIPTAILMCPDGYYIAQVQESDDRTDNLAGGNYKLQWNMKKPYAVRRNETLAVSEANPLYSFNLSSDRWISVFAKDGSARIQYGDTLPTGLTREAIKRSITKKLTNEVNYAIRKRNEARGEVWAGNFYLPTDITASGINTLDKPALLIMMQNVTLGTGGKINSISVGGVKAERRRVVVGFVEGGRRYYCYEKQLPASALSTVVDFYTDVEEAAEAGYYPHYTYLKKPSRHKA